LAESAKDNRRRKNKKFHIKSKEINPAKATRFTSIGDE
jgi:hypothetical protein